MILVHGQMFRVFCPSVQLGHFLVKTCFVPIFVPIFDSRNIMIHLIRQDLEVEESQTCTNDKYFPPEDQEQDQLQQEQFSRVINKNSIIPMSELKEPISRDELIKKFQLPEDSILKIHFEGKLIPWSMVELCDNVEIRVVRPHQNVKPNISDGQSCSDVLIRKKVKELEGRLASLEGVSDPAIISAKTERDLQLLTKQISFLGRRLEEADEAEWIKKT